MKRKLVLFKYPGGKGRIVDKIRTYIDPIIERTRCYNEVFVGGGPILLDIANDPKFSDIKLRANDLDTNVYSFWKIISSGTDTEFGNLTDLLAVSPTVELFYREREKQPKDGEEDKRDEVTKAYHCVFFHKTTFNGMYKARPIGGEKQGTWKIGCHYNKSGKLIPRIEEARRRVKGRLEVFSLPAIDFIRANNGAMYLDPPYYKVGKNLYAVYMNAMEHAALASCVKERSDWVLSYDDCDEVRRMYDFAKINDFEVLYSSSSFKKSNKVCSIKSVKIEGEDILTKVHAICSSKNELIIVPVSQGTTALETNSP